MSNELKSAGENGRKQPTVFAIRNSVLLKWKLILENVRLGSIIINN